MLYGYNWREQLKICGGNSNRYWHYIIYPHANTRRLSSNTLCETHFAYVQALKNYNETTEERKNAFENLKQRDEKSAKEIETQMRKLQRIQVYEDKNRLHMFSLHGVISLSDNDEYAATFGILLFKIVSDCHCKKG